MYYLLESSWDLNVLLTRKQLGFGIPGPIPGLGQISSYSQTPLGGHLATVNQGIGFSNKWVDLFRQSV